VPSLAEVLTEQAPRPCGWLCSAVVVVSRAVAKTRHVVVRHSAARCGWLLSKAENGMRERDPPRSSGVLSYLLDYYQHAALGMADWSGVADRAEITVFTDHLSDPDAVVQRLRPFDVVCAMRERTPLSRKVIERLPRLRMIASTGPVNAAIDVHAAAERNILVTATGYWSAPTVESSLSIVSRASRHQSTHACSVRRPAFRTR
jgi:hypothetical protein